MMMHMNKPQDIESSELVLDVTVLTATTISSESTLSDIELDHNDRIESKHLKDSTTSLWAKLVHVLTLNIIPDDILQKMNLTLSVELFRLFKFLVWTYSLIFSMIILIRWIGWESDATFNVRKFLQYDFTGVALDSIVFFVVGRLYQRQGIDRLFPYLIPAILSCMYSSWITNVWFMRNSFTLHNLRCVWPWQLYLYVGCFGIVAMILMVLHVRASFRDRSLLQRAVEFSIGFAIFIAPFLNNPNFHMHHWYFSWLLAMQSNREEWWSKLTMAIGWGWYINGISAYGRDPILGCSAVKYYSLGNHCSNTTTPRDLAMTNSTSDHPSTRNWGSCRSS
jgi:hypothetical protein